MAAIIGAARLEERLADARQIVVADANAGVLDHDQDIGGFNSGDDGDAPSAIREFHRVGNQIQQDLLERALVGHDFRQVGGQTLRQVEP